MDDGCTDGDQGFCLGGCKHNCNLADLMSNCNLCTLWQMLEKRMERAEFIISRRNAASAGGIRVGFDNDTSAPLILLLYRLTGNWLVSDAFVITPKMLQLSHMYPIKVKKCNRIIQWQHYCQAASLKWLNTSIAILIINESDKPYKAKPIIIIWRRMD